MQELHKTESASSAQENSSIHSHPKHNHPTKKAKKKAKRNPWMIASIVLAVILVLSLVNGYDFDISISKDSSDSANDAAGDDNNDEIDDSGSDDVDLSQFYSDDDPIIGEDDAPVVIVEWSDYQCPFCSRFWSQTLSSIKENYIDTGKVKFVFRNFALSFHSQAKPAALAAECANDQDMFWEYHNLLFENQASLSESNYYIWAEDLGLDMDEWEECFETEKHSGAIDQDQIDGISFGISGTPGFLINGQLLSGAQPYSVFESAIEATLNE